MFEAEMVDSVSGERVAAIVAKGIEETEKRSGDDRPYDWGAGLGLRFVY
jgi:hypothetical protein